MRVLLVIAALVAPLATVHAATSTTKFPNIAVTGTAAANAMVATNGGFKTVGRIQPPAAPTLSVVGTPGSATITYWVIACTDVGCSQDSATATIANAPDTLSGVNYVHISWSAVAGATSYTVLQDDGSHNNGIALNITATSFDDTGADYFDINPVNAFNNTGGVVVNTNSLRVLGHTGLGALGQIDTGDTVVTSHGPAVLTLWEETPSAATEGFNILKAVLPVTTNINGVVKSVEGGVYVAEDNSANLPDQVAGGFYAAYHYGSGVVSEMVGNTVDSENAGIGTILESDQYVAYGIGNGDGTIGNAYSFRSHPYLLNSGITNVYQFYAGQPDSGASQNHYGFYSADLSGAGFTTYNFYSAGATAKNHFEGGVTVAGTVNANDVNVTNEITGSTLVLSNMTANVVPVMDGGSPPTMVPSRTTTNQLDSLYTGLVVPGTYTVATLPTASSYTGVSVICSDVLTPYGTGGVVISDGTNWRTLRGNVKATADLDTFQLYCVEAELTINTPITTALFGKDAMGQFNGGILPRRGVTSGTGAAIAGNVAASAYGNVTSMATGTTTTGSSIQHGPFAVAVANNDRLTGFGAYYVSTVCDGTDTYRVEISNSASSSSSFPSNGSGFIYDMFNTVSHGLTGAATNHWIAFSTKASGPSFVDTGLTPSTSVSTQDRLAWTVSTNAVRFYTNGSLACSITASTNIPIVDVLTIKATILKSAGTNSRTLFEANPALNSRHASRTYP